MSGDMPERIWAWENRGRAATLRGWSDRPQAGDDIVGIFRREDGQTFTALVEALRFYADRANWANDETVNRQELFDVPMGDDLGEIARAALRQITGEG